MTAYPPDQEQQAAFRELDRLRRTDPKPFACHDRCGCRDDDAITTPLDAKDYE